MCKVYFIVDVYIQLPSEADDWWLTLIYNAQPNVHNYERHDHRRRLKAFPAASLWCGNQFLDPFAMRIN